MPSHVRLLSDTHLDCRESGHWWEHTNDFVPARKQRTGTPYFHRYHRCAKCHSVREQLLDMFDQELLVTHYMHSDGYLMTGGRPTKSDVRLEVTRRVTEQSCGFAPVNVPRKRHLAAVK